MKRRDVTLAEVANAVGKSTSTVGAWTQAKNWPEVEIQPELARFLGEPLEWLIHGIEKTEYPEITGNVEAVAEAPPRGVFSGNKAPDIRRDLGSSVKVNTAFRPATGEPTPDDCLIYLRAYLDEARLVPGMVGHTLIELRDRFPIDKVRRMREAHDANTH